MTRPVAFFDFDGTITRHDTFVAFGKYALGKGKFYRKALMASPYILLWKLGLISNSEAKQKFFELMFKGMSKSMFEELCMAFKAVIDTDIRTDMMQKMLWHKAAGHEVVIVSASIGDWICPWALDNGIGKVIATEVETDGEGFLTGRFITPNCYGAEKVRRIREEFGDLASVETYGYSDSDSDKPMLEFVTYPFKV